MANEYPPSSGNGAPGAPDPYDQDAEGGQGAALEQNTPAVAASPTKVMLVLVAVVAGAGFLLFSLFSGDKKDAKTEEPKQQVALPTAEPPPLPVVEQPPAPPPPPEPEPTVALPPVPPPPPLPAAQAPNAPAPTDEARKARLKSEMLIVNQAPKNATAAEQDKARDDLSAGDSNATFANKAVKASEAEKSEATRIGRLSSTIAQGKIINAVMENAVNTDLPGTLRAIVSRDVFAEAGSTPLIPKGSRLIGTYNTDVKRGQKRVFIVWTRVIRPDGVDVKIGSAGTDALGRAGLPGEVDNHYFEAFNAAILTSIFGIGLAAGAEKLTENNRATVTTLNPDGTRTTQEGTDANSPTVAATQSALGTIGSVAKQVIEDNVLVRPTITIPQGTPITVLVNRDLHFPPTAGGSAGIVP